MVETVIDEVAYAQCANCGASLVGNYCHACGEERPDHRDLSFRHFARRTMQELIDFDHSKGLRTMYALLLKPGHLTREYFDGRRTRYLSPLKLFLTVFTLSFLLYTLYKPVSVYDIGTLLKADTTGRGEKIYGELAARKGLSVEDFYERINERIQRYVTWTQHVPVLMISFFMIFIYWNSGRYFVEHLIFSLHLLSFSYLMGVFLWPLTLWLGLGNLWLALVVYPLLYAYLYLALRRVYGGTRLSTALKSVALFVCYFVSVVVSFWIIIGAAVFRTMTS